MGVKGTDGVQSSGGVGGLLLLLESGIKINESHVNTAKLWYKF